MKNLRQEYLYAQEEVKRIQSVPLVIGQFLEAVDQNYSIVGSTTGIITSLGLRLSKNYLVPMHKKLSVHFTKIGKKPVMQDIVRECPVN